MIVWEIFNGIGRIEPGWRREDIVHRFEGVLDRFFQERVSIGQTPMPGSLLKSWNPNGGWGSRSTGIFPMPCWRARRTATG